MLIVVYNISSERSELKQIIHVAENLGHTKT